MVPDETIVEEMSDDSDEQHEEIDFAEGKCKGTVISRLLKLDQSISRCIAFLKLCVRLTYGSSGIVC